MARPRQRKSDEDQSGRQVDLWQAVDAKRLRQLARVVGVVAEEPYQDRLARMDLRFLPGLPLELLEEHVWRPPLEGAGDDQPAGLERRGQLDGRPRRIEVVLPSDP